MDRAELLSTALEAVNARPKAYGPPERNFTRIASHWNVYLTGKYGAGSAPLLDAVDVAAMMALMKIARLEETPDHIDSWVDLAGYAACGAECATVIEHDPDEVALDYWYDDDPSPPMSRFKVGDKVKVRGRDAIGEVTSIDADDESLPYEVRFPNETCSDWPYPSDMRLAATPPRFKVGDEVIFTELPNYKFTVHRIASDGSYSIRDRHGSVFHEYNDDELTPA